MKRETEKGSGWVGDVCVCVWGGIERQTRAENAEGEETG